MKKLDSHEFDRNNCPVLKTVGEIGDSWTLMILRECFLGFRRFEDYRNNLRISKSVLTVKIKKLVASGILTKTAYKESNQRTRYEYRMTEKGKDLYLVLISMIEWGNKYLVDETGDRLEILERETGTSPRLSLLNAEGEELGLRDILMEMYRNP